MVFVALCDIFQLSSSVSIKVFVVDVNLDYTPSLDNYLFYTIRYNQIGVNF